jgi:hypothetical protein
MNWGCKKLINIYYASNQYTTACILLSLISTNKTTVKKKEGKGKAFQPQAWTDPWGSGS